MGRLVALPATGFFTCAGAALFAPFSPVLPNLLAPNLLLELLDAAPPKRLLLDVDEGVLAVPPRRERKPKRLLLDVDEGVLAVPPRRERKPPRFDAPELLESVLLEVDPPKRLLPGRRDELLGVAPSGLFDVPPAFPEDELLDRVLPKRLDPGKRDALLDAVLPKRLELDVGGVLLDGFDADDEPEGVVPKRFDPGKRDAFEELIAPGRLLALDGVSLSPDFALLAGSVADP